MAYLGHYQYHSTPLSYLIPSTNIPEEDKDESIIYTDKIG